MVRHRYKHKRGFGKKNKAIPLAPIMPLIGVVMGDYAASGGLNAKLVDNLTDDIIGYDMTAGKFKAGDAAPFWLAEIAGIVVHKGATKFGINKHVRKLTMGFLEI